MATTTNYGWTTPDDTALVKDGAAAIRTLGTSVDTTVKALSPGTTSGDVDYYTTSTTKARLGIGTTGQVLTVTGGVPVWETPAGGGGMTLISTTTLSSTSVTLSSIPSTYNKIYVVVSGATWGTGSSNIQLLPNNLTTNYGTINFVDDGSAENGVMGNIAITSNRTVLNTGAKNVFVLEIDNYASASYFKAFKFWGYHERTGPAPTAFQVGGGVRTTTAISSLVIQTSNAYTFSAGEVLLYGVK